MTDVEEDRMCEFCGDNPAEPGVPCCDNTRCKRAYAREEVEARRG